MVGAVAIIFHPQATPSGPLTAVLEAARERLVEGHARLFKAAGAGEIWIERERAGSYGEALAGLAARVGQGGLVATSAGAVPRLRLPDAQRLVAVASSGQRRALTNNRFSSDICAVGDARPLRDLPALPADNSLPRWLAERAGFAVLELGGHVRLGLDLDTPLDLALLTLTRDMPAPLRELAGRASLAIPRLEELRAVAADPRRELLVAGRSSSSALAWLERHTACRIRFLAEERGLRAASPLAQGTATQRPRPPRSVLGRLLARAGPEALAATVERLADAAVLDTRVLLADRLGEDEAGWPADEDRFASDLLRSTTIGDPWLRALTVSAAEAPIPILLGSHSLVGPGVPLLFGRTAPRPDQGAGQRA